MQVENGGFCAWALFFCAANDVGYIMFYLCESFAVRETEDVHARTQNVAFDVAISEKTSLSLPVFCTVKFDAKGGACVKLEEEVDAVVCMSECGDLVLGKQDAARGCKATENIDDCVFHARTGDCVRVWKDFFVLYAFLDAHHFGHVFFLFCVVRVLICEFVGCERGWCTVGTGAGI